MSCIDCALRFTLRHQRTAMRTSIGALALAFIASVWTVPSTAQDPRVASAIEKIRSLVEPAILEKKLPGCIVAAGHRDGSYLEVPFGNRQVLPQNVPMTLDTLFDMASITKPVVTATSIMKLIEDGQLRLSDRVATHFPEFAANGKEKITVQDLLVHTSGLIPDNPMSDYSEGPDQAWQRICNLPLTAPVGSAFKYSDVNFIVLGKLVEKRSGLSLDGFVRSRIFEPLGMLESGYNPGPESKARAAPTEKRNDAWIQGEVHDPRAYALDGIAGHAGLFSTLEDLSKYARMMLRGGYGEPINGSATRILSPVTLAKMTASYPVPGGTRGLGWDKQTGFSINRGDLFSPRAFGHGGFTGTVLWIDPDQDLYFIFLSNRVHPSGDGLVNPLAGKIANILSSELGKTPPSPRPSSVMTGLDSLEASSFRELQGQRIGLITNHTGRNREGISTVELLRQAPDVQLTALFSPEHGFEGKLDVAKIGDAQDATTGLKIHSLYGETRRPTPEMLADIDTVVFDIQDIGTRFYTYISTMGEAMKAAAEHRKRFVVLDRPNPIGGEQVDGPMLDPGIESFVAFHSLPIRHGMTIGELARMFREELKLDLELTVVPCRDWTRSQYWDATGLTWINPSPNMRSLNQAILYPGIGIIETTNVSVGRGTDTPFEVVGAPWIYGPALAQAMNALELPGVAFTPIEFTPTSSKHADTLCHGIQFAITDRSRFQSVPTGLALATTLHRLHADAWDTKSLNRLLGNRSVCDAILDGTLNWKLDPRVQQGIFEFQQRRQLYLLYP
jgi:uncharacterized protein YbbC (DUF1343 family)/CubicO group peptidase (beta-lactamase class C family)